MKKLLTVSILIILGMLINVFPQTILFQDDFESYTVGNFPSSNWVLCWSGSGAQNQTVVNDECVSPNQSLKLEGAPNWAGNAHIILSQTPPIIYCEGYLMVKDHLNHHAEISFKNPDIGPWGTYYAGVSIGWQGKILCNGIEIDDCDADVWYHVKMMYDSQKDLCNVWINGELKGSGISCPTNGEYTAFCLQTHNTNLLSRAWFDDVIVYADLLPPEISAIADVPDDQGGQVRINFKRSNIDIPDISNPITSYSVWRFDDILTYITQIPAMQMDQYAVIVPTLHDSCEAGCYYTKFQVVAHTVNVSVFFVSEVDSGYSVDNSSSPFWIKEGTDEIEILKIYPNPTDGIVDFRFSIFDFQRVTLKIYDLYGREVKTLVDEEKYPGEYTVRMDVLDLPAGVYLVRIQVGGQGSVKKLIVQ